MSNSASLEKQARRPRGFLNVFALIAMLIVLLVGSAYAYWYFYVPVPEVYGNTFVVGTKVKLDYAKPLKISFSTAMDRESVEKAFRINPEIDGSFSWDQNTLVFTPSAGSFTQNQEVVVEINSEAKSVFQKHLEYNFYQQFALVGPPEVLLMAPKGTVDDPLQRITVVFDRPMKPMTTLQDEKLYDPDFRFEPALTGYYKWRGTNTVEFIPDKLLLGTTYTVTIPKETPSLFGDALTEDVIWSFDTAEPRVMSSAPELRVFEKSSFDDYIFTDDYNNYARVSDMSLQWNQPVSTELFEKNAIIKEKEDTSKTYALKNASCNEEGICTFETTVELPLETFLYLEVGTGVESTVGEAVSKNTYVVPFRVPGEFKVTSSSPEMNAEEDVYGTATVYFNHNLKDVENIDSFIEIEPAVENLSVMIGSYYEDEMYIYGDFAPSTSYTITISSDIKDVFDQGLKEPFSVSFKTLPLYPSLYFVEWGDAFVPKGDGAFAYAVTSLNVNSYTISVAPVPMDEYIRVVTEEYYSPWGSTVSDMFPGLEMYSREIQVDSVLNEPKTDQLNLSELFPEVDFSNGIFALKLDSGDTKRPISSPLTADQMMNISDHGIVFKYTPTDLYAWVTDVRTGAPEAGVSIRVYTDGSALLATGSTDENGLYHLLWEDTDKSDVFMDHEMWEMPSLVVVAGDEAITYQYDDDGIANWMFNISSRFLESPYRGYLYTDRPLYRPGQTVFFKGFLRNQNDVTYTISDLKEVRVKIFNNEYTEIYNQVLPLNEWGSYSGSLVLDEASGLGSYYLETHLKDEEEDDMYIYEMPSDSFRVEEYKKPEYKVETKTDKEEYFDGDTMSVSVNAEYYFGGPLKDAEATISVYSEDYYFSKYDDYRYSFGLSDGYYCFWCNVEKEREYIIEKEDTMSADGTLTFDVPINLADKKTGQLYVVEVGITDPLTSQVVYASVPVVVNKGDFYLGIKNEEYVVASGETAHFNIVSVDTEGNLIPDKSGKVEFYKRTWDTVRKKNVDGYYYFESTANDELVDTKSFSTDKDGRGSAEYAFSGGGEYFVKVVSEDTKGHEVAAGTMMYVASAEYVGWFTDNNDRIELIPDKPEYEIGDTAKILVKSPYETANVWITGERRGIFDSRVETMTSNNSVIEIPIEEKHMPNFYVSAVLVDAGAETPGFKMGYANIKVNSDSKNISIDLNTDKEFYQPGDEVTLNIALKDAEGNPIDAEISVGVVDESLLALVGGMQEDPLARFYDIKPLAVTTASNFVRLIERIDVTNPKQGKGGGGGDENDYLRRNFKDTAFWVPIVDTESGKATVTFTMPDNLTSWQIMVVAHNKETYVGADTTYIKTTKPLQIRPVISRFAVTGDTMTVGAIVRNDTTTEQKVSLKTKIVAGDDILENTSDTLKLGTGQEEKQEWTITIPTSETVTFTWTAEGQGYNDGLEMNIPVYKFVTPETVSLGGMINEKNLEAMVLPEYIDPDLGTVTVKLYPSVLGVIQEPISYLVDYQYLCAEQVTSSILPRIFMKEIAALNSSFTPPDSWNLKELDTDVSTALQKIYAVQKFDGGFGFWEESPYSDPNISVYILYGLYQIQSAGYSVDQKVIDDGLNYVVNLTQVDLDGWYMRNSSSQWNYYDNYLSYMNYVLSMYGKESTLSSAQSLFDRREGLANYSKAFLAMAFENMAVLDENASIASSLEGNAQTLVSEIEQDLKQSSTGTHVSDDEIAQIYFNTEIRSTAIAALAMLQVEHDSPVIPKLMNYLMNTKENGVWGSTQENIWALAAFVTYLQNTEEMNADFDYAIYINQDKKHEGRFSVANLFEVDTWSSALKDLADYPALVSMGFDKDGDGVLYYDVNLEYYLDAEAIPSLFEGMGVYKEYFNLDDKEYRNPLSELTVGEDVMVRVTLLIPDDRRYVLVEDYLPAGLEAQNFTFETTSRAQAELVNEAMDWDEPGYVYVSHRELRDDRVAFFIDYVSEGVYELYYVARATTPGTFKVRPSHIEEMYFPDVFGRSEGYEIVVTPKR